MAPEALSKFVAPENTWMHDAIAVLDEVFGIADTEVTVDHDGNLDVRLTADEA